VGVHQVRFATTDAVGTIGTVSMLVDVRPPWRQVQFPGDYGNAATEATIWGFNADPDGDGLTNRDEYRFGSDPKNPASRGSVTYFAQPQSGAVGLQMRFLRRRYDPTLVYAPEGSSDLGTWNGGPSAVREVSAEVVYPGGEFESVTVEAAPTTIVPSASRYFLRLRVVPSP
jgi:hypothetical protein